MRRMGNELYARLLNAPLKSAQKFQDHGLKPLRQKLLRFALAHPSRGKNDTILILLLLSRGDQWTGGEDGFSTVCPIRRPWLQAEGAVPGTRADRPPPTKTDTPC